MPIAANYGIHDTFVRDGLAFVSAWNEGVMIFDVGNGVAGGSPSNPRLVSTTPTVGGETHNAWWFWNPHTGEKKYLFVGEEGPSPGRIASGDIHVLDVSDLAHPTEVAFFHLDSAGTHNFWMDEDAQILYAAYYNQGIIALDVSGSLNGDLSTRLIDSIRPGGENTYTWGVQLQGSLYAIDMLTGFWQLELAGGKFSVLGGGNNVSERYSSDLAVGKSGFAYTGTWGSGRTTGVSGNAVKIWKLDVSGSPTLADSIVTTGIGTVSDIQLSPDGKLLMFSAENGPNAGFWFYRLANPAKPTFAGTVPGQQPEGRPHGQVRDHRRAAVRIWGAGSARAGAAHPRRHRVDQ